MLLDGNGSCFVVEPDEAGLICFDYGLDGVFEFGRRHVGEVVVSDSSLHVVDGGSLGRILSDVYAVADVDDGTGLRHKLEELEFVVSEGVDDRFFFIELADAGALR